MDRRVRREVARRNRVRRQRATVIGIVLIVLAACVGFAVWSASRRGDGSPHPGVAKADSSHVAQAQVPSATPTLADSPSPQASDSPSPQASDSPSPQASDSPVEKTLPERMARLLPGSDQIIVITGSTLGSKSGRLKVYDHVAGHWIKVMSVPADFGANGLVDGATRTAGHLQTPTGIWHIGSFLFGQHAAPPLGTRMPYRQIRQDSWWSAESDSTYNSWVSSTHPISGEHLADAQVQYEWAFNTGYNSRPNETVVGRGTAIFIHCAEPPDNSLGPYTHGCIAIDAAAMKQLFAALVPGRHPTCAIGTLREGSSTSIWSY
jgi:L,D-peptidoglycan transpeptidase YkuD (ErfK/YbiS/YcfS/YnhG family)